MLSLAFEGGQPETEPVLANIPNLQTAYIGPSRKVSVVNGQVSSSITYSFQVIPRQTGDFVIPSLTVEVAGQKLTSQPLELKVLKPMAPPPAAVASGSQIAFLKITFPKQEIYVGESVVAQLQLFLHNRVQRIAGFQVTGAPEGLNMGKMMEGQRRQVQINSVVYTVIPLHVAFTAVKAGSFPSSTLTATAVVEVQTGTRRRDPFFEQFGMRDPFGMLGGATEQQQLTLATDPEPLRLLQVPTEDKPPLFNGAVGTYTMNVSVGPTNVTAGDPVTVKVQISGRGSIDGIALPEQPDWDNFKKFPTTSKVETTDQLGLQGSKTFEQIVSPENAQVQSLPSMSFSFFDPEQRKYLTLTHPPVPLLVRAGAAPPALTGGPNAPGQANAPPAQDIVPNKQRLGALALAGKPLILHPWFLTLQGIPMFVFVTSVLWRRRADSFARNPRLRRQREVAVIVAHGLLQLRQLASEKKSDEFFATVFRLLQEQLGERLDLPASAITEAVVQERLRPRGVPPSVTGPVEDLFQTCNLARYAPVKTSQELEAIIPKLDQTLRQIAALK